MSEEQRMKVKIDRDRDGWRYFVGDLKSDAAPSYPEAARRAKEAGHEVDNGGWIRRLLSWQWNHHALDGYPEWEIAEDGVPAFVKVAHVRGDRAVESNEVASAWDDVAEADFYQRDWTSDGIPFVSPGETYWSGWWFATKDERDRFVAWYAARATR